MLRYHRSQILPIHPILPICPNFQFQQPPFCLPSMWVLCAFFETAITTTKPASCLFYTKPIENQLSIQPPIPSPPCTPVALPHQVRQAYHLPPPSPTPSLPIPPISPTPPIHPIKPNVPCVAVPQQHKSHRAQAISLTIRSVGGLYGRQQSSYPTKSQLDNSNMRCKHFLSHWPLTISF